MASEYRGDNGSLSWQVDYDYDRYGNRTSVSSIGYLAGSAGILPAMSAQREPTGSEPEALATGWPTAIAQISLPTDLMTSKSGLELPAALRTAARSSSATSNSHHARASNLTLTLAAAASPQGPPPKIAFASNRGGSAQIYSMNPDGSGQTRLSNNPPTNDTNDESPRWSPNNSRILFQSDRDHPFCGVADIYVMNADGSGQVNVSNGSSNDGQPSWSPDGTKLAFSSDRDAPGRPSLYVMNANGSNQTRLTFTSAPFKDEQPVWSPDGTRIAFVSTRDSIIESWPETDDEGGILTRTAVRTNKEVYLMNADGTNQVRLTNTLENDDSPAWVS